MSGNTSLDNQRASNAGFWTKDKWFFSVAIFLILWVAAYFFAHWSSAYTGYEYARFTTQQIQQINRILYNNGDAATAGNRGSAVNTSPVFDTIYRDSTRIIVSQQVTNLSRAARADICDDSCHINKAMLYIKSEFDNKIKEDQLAVIRQYISSFGSQEVGSFLADLKVKVRSYFWLTGPMVYLEIVFWVIIGVISSIMFAIGNVNRIAGGSNVIFREGDIPYQVAKLFYAPFCTIILVLSYNYIKHRNVIEVNTNEGMIVFSFFAGLFSGRTMSLLERFKDVLLPEHTIIAPSPTAMMQTQYNSIGALAAPPPPPSYKERHPDREPYQPAQKPYQPAQETYQPKQEPYQPAQEAYQPTQEAYTEPYPVEKYDATEQENQPDEIKEALISLKLDVSGLFEEEKNELMLAGYANAVVTLHNVNGKNIITVKKSENTASGGFIARHVLPGIYIVRATLTQKLSNDYVMNLFGEKTAYITHENNNIELFIKKYEAID